MSKRLGLLGLVLALGLACGLYALKDQVQHLERQLVGARAAIVAERAALERLRTESAMLNQPSRVARLAEQYLRLVPAQPSQIMAIRDIPLRSELLLSSRSWETELASGSPVTLRFKPQRSKEALQAIAAAGRRTTGGAE